MVKALSGTSASINSRGQVVGGYLNSMGEEHGFLYYRGVFTTIEPPGSLQSEIDVIEDNGRIGGSYTGTDGLGHGFIGTPIH